MAKRKIDFTVRDAWNQDSLLLYKEAVSRYPYCAPARLSFLLNLKALGDPDYERELTLTALAMPDRGRLREEVQAVEKWARMSDDRRERRTRQVARWTADAASVAAGRLMRVGAVTAPSGTVLPSDEVVLPSGDGSDRGVDFRAVAANEPDLLRSENWERAGAGEAACLTDGFPAADGGAEADGRSVADMADYPEARSRSARRNARRRARREAEREAALRQALDDAQADSAAAGTPALSDEPAPRTISMLWAAEPASEPVAPAAEPLPAKAPSAARLFKRRRREAFDPWADVFTAKHTISDHWAFITAPSVPPPAPTPAPTPAPAPPAGPTRRAATPAAVPRSAAPTQPAPVPARSRRAAKSEAPLRPAAPSPEPAVQPARPAYIDPNELIDRFLRKNDDHILIRVDETRDYSAFDPDRGSLREDWSMGSETLAQLYLKQGSPDKAIEIYRYLGLKFPEKKRYFASLIRAAEKERA